MVYHAIQKCPTVHFASLDVLSVGLSLADRKNQCFHVQNLANWSCSHAKWLGHRVRVNWIWMSLDRVAVNLLLSLTNSVLPSQLCWLFFFFFSFRWDSNLNFKFYFICKKVEVKNILNEDWRLKLQFTWAYNTLF